MRRPPRVALLADCFHEINGAAHTCRQLEAYAARHDLPLLCVRCGKTARRFESGSVTAFELKRSWATFPVDTDFGFDPLLWRQSSHIGDELRAFRPDIIHIISPGDLGELGAYWAHKLGIPLIASFHTNLHQYAATRLEPALRWMPRPLRTWLAGSVGRLCEKGLSRFYQIPRLLLVPNTEIQDWLSRATGRPCRIMGRGVDTYRFNPAWRDVRDGVVRLGYVGRLTVEKNVQFLAEIDGALRAAGHSNYRFLVVGDGAERKWLERNLVNAEFTGVLRGRPLTRAYANMDLFVFPSRTDAFGNVILEAMASGVPPVVGSQGGPKHLVRSGVSGFTAGDDRDFVQRALSLVEDSSLRQTMALAARRDACLRSWEEVFGRVYEAYRECIESAGKTLEIVPESVPALHLEEETYVPHEAAQESAQYAGRG